MLQKIILIFKIIFLLLFQYFCFIVILILFSMILKLSWLGLLDWNSILENIISFVIILVSLYLTTYFVTKLLKNYLKIEKIYFKTIKNIFLLCLFFLLSYFVFNWYINIYYEYSMDDNLNFILFLGNQIIFFLVYFIFLKRNFNKISH